MLKKCFPFVQVYLNSHKTLTSLKPQIQEAFSDAGCFEITFYKCSSNDRKGLK